MKSVAVAPGKREVRLIEQEPARLDSPTDVKLRMLEVGVCGSPIAARHPAEAYRDLLLGPPQGIKNVLTFA